MSLNIQIKQLTDRVAAYKRQPKHSHDMLLWMENLLIALKREQQVTDTIIKQYTDELNEAVQVVRKQALIMEIHGIKFPTINQSEGSLLEMRQIIRNIETGKTATIPFT
jgi:SUMO ligase MMS21 Smc5/6 complex component